MKRKNERRWISIAAVLAMVFSLFTGMTFPAFADSTPDTSWYTGHEGDASYTLADADDLAGLASLVNAGNSFSGKTINLNGESTYDLSGYTSWTPIGTGTTTSSGDYSLISTGKPFAGIFNGNGAEIQNMNISSGSQCLGLFGYSTGGIMNVKIASGSITRSSTTTYAVGGVVGYSAGSIRSCSSNVTISVGSNSRHTGGIAGVLINNYKSTSEDTPWTTTIDYCKNTGNVTAGGRCAGIVGSALCYVDGKIQIDRCMNTAVITANTSGKVWSGGVVGYCMGDITNCLHTGTIALSGRYMGGIAGILYGYSGNITASMSNCLTTGGYGSGCSSSTVRPLYNSADGNSDVKVTNSMWTNTTYPQVSDGADWRGIVEAYGTKTKTQAVAILGDKWSEGAETDTYPVLKWVFTNSPLMTGVEAEGTTSTTTSTDATDAVYLDGVSGDDLNTGLSKTSPVKSLNKAIEKLEEDTTKTIYILNTVEVSTVIDISAIMDSYGLSSVSITRSDQFGGYLFDIPAGGVLSLSNVTIDGNKTNLSTDARSIINVRGGTLNIGSGTIMQNNVAGNYGGAVRVIAGTANMTGGSIIGNSAISGGGVAALSTSSLSYGTFTISGGTISGNSAQLQGSGVYKQSDAVFNNNGGTISDAIYSE